MEGADVTTTANVNGTCDSRFEGVGEAFAENFASLGDVGAPGRVIRLADSYYRNSVGH